MKESRLIYFVLGVMTVVSLGAVTNQLAGLGGAGLARAATLSRGRATWSPATRHGLSGASRTTLARASCCRARFKPWLPATSFGRFVAGGFRR